MAGTTQAATTTVAVIGSGFAGLCLGHHLRQAGIPFVILEKADSLGGTWRENTYPGAACDVPSILYSFSFAPKPDWSRLWSPQAEILQYLEDTAERLGVGDHIRFGAEVEHASFDEARGIWTVDIAGGETVEAEMLVSCVGQLHRPSIPTIAGRDEFTGIQFHSARWRHDVDLSGKTVAVIGNAASAIQLIPEVAKRAGAVKVFQRSANWMMRRNDREYTDAEKERHARRPWLRRLHRMKTWLAYESQFPVFAGSRLAGRLYTTMAMRHLQETVADPELRSALTPDYPIGAKRILISDDYYDTLSRDNVEVVLSGVERVDARGVVDADGHHHDVDVIVYATGFRSTEFLVPMRIEGRDGVSLEDVWTDGAEAYLGLTVSGFPNFFMMYGPNTNLGHNSIIFMLECQTAYIMDCLRRMRRAGLRWIDVRPGVMRDYNERLQRTLVTRIWSRVAESWYKNDAGRNTNNWSGTTAEYWWRTRSVDLSKYEVRARARVTLDQAVSGSRRERPAA